MSKKNKKDVAKVEESKPQVNPENQETAVAKVEESKPQVNPENQETAVVKVEDATKKASAPVTLTLPAETPYTCIQDGKYWGSKEDIFDKTAFECKDCEKDHPGQQLVCAARTAYLLSNTSKKIGAVRTPRAKSKKTDGAPNQTDLINSMIKSSTPLSEMVEALAKAHYGENVKGAERRIKRHVKSICNNACTSAAEMKPYVVYLTTAHAA